CDFEPGSTIAYPWRSCMLRRMFLSHRPLSIYLLTSFAISLAVGGCKSEETKEAAPEAAKADAGSTETKTPTEPENKAVEAPKPTEQATAPVEDPPKLAASIDDLFHLIADGEDGSYIMVRDPQAFVTYADEIFRFYERPLKELASASAANASINRDVSDFEKKFGEGKRQYEEAATKLKESGIDLSQGIVLTSPNKEWGDG